VDAPGGVNCSARRCLQLLMVLRRLAPGDTCPLPSGLEAVVPSDTCPPLGDLTVVGPSCWTL